MHNLKLRILVAMVFILIGIIIGLSIHNEPNIPTPTPSIREVATIRIRHDTVLLPVAIAPKPIALAGISSFHNTQDSSTTYHFDTLIKSDTSSIAADTISISHTLPVDSFSVMLAFAPRRVQTLVPYLARDSIITQVDTLTNTVTIGPSWFEQALMILLGVLGGWILGKV